jgi:hypothetical protein
VYSIDCFWVIGNGWGVRQKICWHNEMSISPFLPVASGLNLAGFWRASLGLASAGDGTALEQLNLVLVSFGLGC